MYIKSARIQNIRSIEDFEINFDEPAGWHVLIGDNGSGKSTIIRSLALALVSDESPGLRDNPRHWIRQKCSEGEIDVVISISEEDKYSADSGFKRENDLNISTLFKEMPNSSNTGLEIVQFGSPLLTFIRGDGWFSAAYGPYRRFSGGSQEWDKVYANQPRLGAHLSAFGEDVALTEPIAWLIKLNYQELEQRLKEPFAVSFIKGRNQENYPAEDSEGVLGGLKKLINSTDFLPNQTKFEDVSSKGVFFRDGNENLITINQLSDGYRSILSLTLELIRQLIRVYDEDNVFKNIREDKMYIDLPGVVLIDEIDAHLHPTWQTKIGQWFLKYFPNLQFIVTTHSPLVCRAAEKGTIWKLAAPGSEEKSGQVTGVDRQRLIYGNILDAYGTEVFGEDVSRSEKSAEMLKELAALSVKSFKGKITDNERKRADQLKQILPTE